ncbi:MAG: serine protease [Candidatus Nanoarchaeia archaeon]
MKLSRRGVLLLPTIIGLNSMMTTTPRAQTNNSHSILKNPTGIALAVKDKLTFITNAHSLNDENKVEFYNQRVEQEFSPREMSIPHPNLDIAIFKLQRPQNLLTPFQVSEMPIQIGKEYRAILNNQSYTIPIYTKTQVPNNKGDNYEVYEGYALPVDIVYQGLSGSPILDSNDEVVGFITGEYKKPIKSKGKMYQTPLITNLGGLEQLMQNKK